MWNGADIAQCVAQIRFSLLCLLMCHYIVITLNTSEKLVIGEKIEIK